MDIHVITTNSFRPHFMSKNERRIIIETFLKFNDSRVNFLRMVEILKEHNVIDDTSYKTKLCQYLHICHAQREKQLWLVFPYIMCLTFDNVVAVLREMGCHEITRALLLNRYGLYIGQMSKAAVPNVQFTFSYYEKIKSYIDNHVFVDNISGLQTLIDKQKLVVGSVSNESDADYIRQKASDRVVALYALLVQQYFSHEERIQVLENMKDSVPSDLDTSTLESVYQSKKAITEAIVGNRAKAFEHSHAAEVMCYNREPGLAALIAKHDRQFVHIQFYMKFFRSEDLFEILRLGDDVVEMVMERKDDGQNQWKRVVLLFKAMSLLRITPQFDVVYWDPLTELKEREGSFENDISVKKKYMAKIEGVLKEVRLISNTTEVRREMIFSICMARLRELSGNLEAAVTYLDEAIRLAKCGGVFFDSEKENINRYMEKLKRNVIRQRADKGQEFGNTELLYQR